MIRYLLLCVLVVIPTRALAGDDTALYDKYIAIATTDDRPALQTYMDSLSQQELLLLGKQACLVEGENLTAASFMVNMSLELMARRFPEKVLDACISFIKDTTESTLWREEGLRWIRSASCRGKGSPRDGKNVKKIMELCNPLISSKKEEMAIRCRAMRCVRRVLESQTRRAYREQASYIAALKKDEWDNRGALKAAIKAGFANPWEELLEANYKKLLSILEDLEEPKEMQKAAAHGLWDIHWYVASDKVVEDIGKALRRMVSDERYDCAVATGMLVVLVEGYEDLELADQVEAVLARARKAKEKDTDSIERCRMLLQRIRALKQTPSTQPASKPAPTTAPENGLKEKKPPPIHKQKTGKTKS